MPNYATREQINTGLNKQIVINAGHVRVVLQSNDPNYQDIIEQVADMMCSMHPIALLDKLKNA